MATSNQYSTLSSLLTAIANSIRTKTGVSTSINAQDFPSEIISIKPSFELITSDSEVQIEKTYTLSNDTLSKYSYILIVTCGGNNDSNTNTSVSASNGIFKINTTVATPYVSYRSAIGGMTIALLMNWNINCVLTMKCGFWGSYAIYGIV